MTTATELDDAAFAAALRAIDAGDDPPESLADHLIERGEWDAEATVLRLVCQFPDSGGARLVAARWYADHGGTVPCPVCTGDGLNTSACPECHCTGRVPDARAARAEFIRVQCRIAEIERSLPADPDAMTEDDAIRHDIRERLAERSRELLAAHGREWVAPVAVAAGATPDADRQWGPGRPFLFATAAGDVALEFRRGFVEAVSLPEVAAFVGGQPCPTCAEQGRPGQYRYRTESGSGWRDCPACQGTGRVVGLAAALARAAPLRRVEFADREPYSSDRGVCCWFRDSADGERADQPSYLPPPLFDLLDSEVIPRVRDFSHKDFPTRQAATDAASLAAVLLGRRRAFPAAGGEPG